MREQGTMKRRMIIREGEKEDQFEQSKQDRCSGGRDDDIPIFLSRPLNDKIKGRKKKTS